MSTSLWLGVPWFDIKSCGTSVWLCCDYFHQILRFAISNHISLKTTNYGPKTPSSIALRFIGGPIPARWRQFLPTSNRSLPLLVMILPRSRASFLLYGSLCLAFMMERVSWVILEEKLREVFDFFQVSRFHVLLWASQMMKESMESLEHIS